MKKSKNWIVECINQDGEYYESYHEDKIHAEMDMFMEMEEFMTINEPFSQYFNIFSIYHLQNGIKRLIIREKIGGCSLEEDVGDLWEKLSLIEFMEGDEFRA